MPQTSPSGKSRVLTAKPFLPSNDAVVAFHSAAMNQNLLRLDECRPEVTLESAENPTMGTRF